MFASGKGMRTLRKRTRKNTYCSLYILEYILNFIGLRFHGWWSPCWEKGRNTEHMKQNLTKWAWPTEFLEGSLRWCWNHLPSLYCDREKPAAFVPNYYMTLNSAAYWNPRSAIPCTWLSHCLPSLVHPLIHHFTKFCSLPLFEFWVSWLIFFSFPTAMRNRFLGREGPPFFLYLRFSTDLKLEGTGLKFQTIVSLSNLSQMVLINACLGNTEFLTF